jgi:hypothetical protein
LSFLSQNHQDVSTNTLTNKCFGIILGIPVPFPLPEPSACNMGASCPVSAGDFNTIQISLPILKEYPSVIHFLRKHPNLNQKYLL